ncbi:MAG: thiol-disulfide oxidoreductase [Spirochaetes bacterium RBG_16_49_21]|nr:MAG: thiol-disulfide oxidoreductase [Spirochaetes bacterium RBG_16_49_21]
MDLEMIILFDGVCNLCEASVNFIIKRDKKKKFRFVPLQSDAGAKLLEDAGIRTDRLDTLILLKHGIPYTKSRGALEITRELDGLWRLLYAFIIVPRPIRDAAYSLIAKNRYKWFGKKDACMVPDDTVRNRFIIQR